MPSSLFNQQSQNQINQINPQILNKAKSIMNDANKLKSVIDMLNGKGMNAEQMVRSICQQQGINVDQLMSMLK